MPLFYHKYVNYVLAHSVNYVITLYRLAPPADCRKTSIIIKNGRLALLALLVLHRAKLLASNQSILALGVAPRWVAGTPVPVYTPGTDAGRVCTRALHEAKPIECPKGDRDNKSEVYFKNRLFLQTEKSLALRQDSFAFLP